MTDSTQPSQLAYLSKSNYVACMCDSDWYIGVVQDVCNDGDVKVSFMHAKGPGCPENSFF